MNGALPGDLTKEGSEDSWNCKINLIYDDTVRTTQTAVCTRTQRAVSLMPCKPTSLPWDDKVHLARILFSKFICRHCFSDSVHQLIYFNCSRESNMSWEGRRDGSGGSQDNKVPLDTWKLCSNFICCRFFSNLVHQLPNLFYLKQTIKFTSGREERRGRDSSVHSEGKIYDPLQPFTTSQRLVAQYEATG